MKALADALKNWVNLKQRDDESLTDYLKRSKAAMEVFYLHAGSQYCFPKTVQQNTEFENIESDVEHAITARDNDAYNEAQDKLKKLQKKTMDEFESMASCLWIIPTKASMEVSYPV